MESEMPVLSADRRDSSLRNGGQKTYRAGLVPGVVYGGNVEPFTIQCDPRDVASVLKTSYGRNQVFTLAVDGEEHLCMLKETQFEPVRRELTHMDLYVVDPEQTVVVEVPVAPRGTSVGEKLGGLLQVVSRTLKVRCMVKDIPATVDHDVSDLQVGDAVYVDEFTAPAGGALVFKNRFPVIRIASRRGAVQAEVEGEGEVVEQEPVQE